MYAARSLRQTPHHAPKNKSVKSVCFTTRADPAQFGSRELDRRTLHDVAPAANGARPGAPATHALESQLLRPPHCVSCASRVPRRRSLHPTRIPHTLALKPNHLPPLFSPRTSHTLQADVSGSAPAIPVQRVQTDLLRDGASALKQSALAPHPVESLQANVSVRVRVLGGRRGGGAWGKLSSVRLGTHGRAEACGARVD